MNFVEKILYYVKYRLPSSLFFFWGSDQRIQERQGYQAMFSTKKIGGALLRAVPTVLPEEDAPQGSLPRESFFKCRPPYNGLRAPCCPWEDDPQ